MPADLNQQATDAIEQYLAAHRPEELELIWRERKPDTDWGMSELAWRGVGANMIVNFNQLDPQGPQIDAESEEVDNAVRNLHDSPLGDFHQFIVDQAEEEEGQ